MAGGAAKHSQKVAGGLMTCPDCIKGNCEGCVDRLRLLVQDDRICTCKKSGHEDAMQGEARLKQIADPETGDIHGPGLVVTRNGEVKLT